MFKNTRMFSSGSNATSLIASRINIKAVLLMLVMMIVGFGVFGGSVFAAEYPEGRAVFRDGHSVQLSFKLASDSIPDGGSLAYVHTDHKIKSIKRSSTIDPSKQTDSHLISDSSSDIPIYFWFEEDGGTVTYQEFNYSTHQDEEVTANTGNIYWYTTDPNPILNEDAGLMFSEFQSATEIDTSDFDLSYTNSVSAFFDGDEALKKVDVKNWIPSSYTGNVDTMFRNCKSITEIDLSTWNTANIGSMMGIFYGMSNLKTIYVSENFSVPEGTGYIFYQDTKLVGGKGTTFKEVGAYEDHQFAHIDGGPDNPGYFTNIADKPVSSPDENATTGTGTDNADGTVTVQIPITKLMHMNAADATILNDYTFTMTPAEAVHTQASYTGTTSPAQTDNTVTIHKEAFNRINELNSNNNKVVISNVNNNNASGVDNDVFTLTFTNGQIGQFHYHVVETPITSGLQSGVTQDSTLYDIVVTIENKDPNNITSGEVKFAGVTMSTSTDGGNTWTKTNTSESTKSDRGGAGVDINNAKFTNTFHTADVLVDKTVRGSLGDKTKDFTFTFNVQGTNIPTTYKLYKTNAANETAGPVDVQNGSTFTLKHGESAKVMGLPEGASYHITETGTADYTTKIDADLGDESFNGSCYTLVGDTAVAMNGDMYENVAGQTGGESISVSKFNNEGSDIAITSASNLDEQHFTNMKGQLIPTGLIENMASFLGLALIAAFAIGYMIYKKKKDTVSEEA